ITITINNKLGIASIKTFSPSFRLILPDTGYFFFFAIKYATNITPNPHRIPGIYPAANKAAIDVPPLTRENKINVLLGGINKPVGADEILTDAENSLS